MCQSLSSPNYRFGVSGGQSSEVEARVGEGQRPEVGGRCWGWRRSEPAVEAGGSGDCLYFKEEIWKRRRRRRREGGPAEGAVCPILHPSSVIYMAILLSS
jgi:hypothetical protein